MKLIKTILLLIGFYSCIFSQTLPYVILVSFDGFRWDYSERGITPNLDKMKLNGVHASSLRPIFPSKTFPNHYSIVTGMYAENHGLISNSFINPLTEEKYKVGDTVSVRESKWYLGEAFWETAQRNGIKTASYFWPGSEVDIDYRRPSLYKKYEHNQPYKQRIDGVIEWLKLPKKNRPHFITLYFHDTDSYGHKYGPNSPEINNSIQRMDNLVGYLNSRLKSIGFIDSTNIIIVSDHGMTEISSDRAVNIEELLSGYDYKFGGAKPFVMIDPSKEDFGNVYQTLKENENHYKVYLKKNLPGYFHYSKHPFIYPIILLADIGWSLVNNEWLRGLKYSDTKGNHGFDNNHLDMHGVFIAKGTKFKSGYKTGTVWNIDIYPLLCEIFGIEPRTNIDGRLERIEFILN